ncbi:hypothetical protein MBLNU13_g03290t1 [Cladosporium sp. NU13]
MDSWEQHKDLLRTLYSSKDRGINTLRSIMTHMQAKHTFVRSKSQYERQFKKWGFRKNNTSEDWKTIHGKIQKRQNQGKKSAVYKSGKHVQVEKLNKEKRHNFRKAEDLFNSHRSSGTVCCVESFCRHAIEEVPPTPEGFTVCTPISETVPPLFTNNLPSLQLFGQLRSFASASARTLFPPNPNHKKTGDLDGINQTVSAGKVSWPHSFIDQPQVASAEPDITTSEAILGQRDHNDGDSLDLTLLEEPRLIVKDLQDLFQVSSTGKLSPLVFPLLHLASNNLLPLWQARGLASTIRAGSGRQVFNALISTRSPATQAISRSLLPHAIEPLDMELVRTLLGTGLSPDVVIGYDQKTPLQYALAQANLDKGVSDLVQLLLEHGARVNLPWANGTSSPLVYAAGNCRVDIVQLLLTAGADVNAHASTGEITALQAAAGGYIGFPGFRAQAGSDRLKTAQLLLDAGADVNAKADTIWSRGTALQEAMRSENVTLVHMLLSHGADVNAPASFETETPLQSAVSTGNLDIIDLLLTWGASDIPAAFERALVQGQRQAAQALLSFGAGLDDTNDAAYKLLALREAIRFGDYHSVQGILETNVDVDAWIHNGNERKTALQEAALNTRIDLDIVRLMISSGADVNAPAMGNYGRTALQNAVRTGNMQLALLFLDAGADVNAAPSKVGGTALEEAAGASSPETVKLLLDHGADTFRQGASATMAAIMADYGSGSSIEIVQLLLSSIGSSGVDSSVTSSRNYEIKNICVIDFETMSLLLELGILNNKCALRYGISRRDYNLVKLALDFGGEVEDEVLRSAIGMSELGIMQILLDHGYDPEHKTRTLQWAARLGSYEDVKHLLRAGADVNAAPSLYWAGLGEELRTALQAAAQFGHLDVVRLLLEEGAEVERSSISRNEQGTALQFAAISGSITIANELIQRGANVNAAPMGKNGRTALEGAAEHGRLDMVQLLLNLEAEVQGSRALQFARKEGHDGVVMLLRQNGFEDDVCMSG